MHVCAVTSLQHSVYCTLSTQHCTMNFNGYTKDLSTVCQDMSSIFILDNSPAAYRDNPGTVCVCVCVCVHSSCYHLPVHQLRHLSVVEFTLLFSLPTHTSTPLTADVLHIPHHTHPHTFTSHTPTYIHITHTHTQHTLHYSRQLLCTCPSHHTPWDCTHVPHIIHIPHTTHTLTPHIPCTHTLTPHLPHKHHHTTHTHRQCHPCQVMVQRPPRHSVAGPATNVGRS